MISKIKKVYIEITNVCNFNCRFCVKSKREPRFMSAAEFETVLINIKPVSDSVYFHVLGEPLLNGEIGEMLDLCEKHGFTASITTNASLLDATKSKLLGKKMLRQINYSLHSISENGKDYNETVLSINRFIEEAGDNLYHVLRLWDMPESEETTHGNGIKIAKNIFIQKDHPFTWGNIENADFVFQGKCHALRHNCGILADGTVVACCLDANGDLALGNIFQNNLLTIINSERAASIYDGFSRNIPVEKLCRTCGFLKRLNGKRSSQKL